MNRHLDHLLFTRGVADFALVLLVGLLGFAVLR